MSAPNPLGVPVAPNWALAELLAGEFAVPVIPVPSLANRAAEIAARFFGHPGNRLEIFAVTGTAAKTCVSHCCAQAVVQALAEWEGRA